MSETFSSTRASIAKLKKSWSEADQDTRWDVGFWAAGLLMMAVAITAQFGGFGFLFCAGFVIWTAANNVLRS
jgi:hypothetical protein